MERGLGTNHPPLLIIGAGIAVLECAAAWSSAQPSRRIEILEVKSADNFNYDIAPLEAYDGREWRAFAALSNEAINFPRLKLMTDLRLSGWRLERFVSPHAMAPPGWIPGENSFVSAGAVIGIQCATKHNCWIGPRAVIGANVKLGHSVWIGPGAIVGEGVVVGDNTSIGSGAIVSDGVIVGRQCELLLAREYGGASIADRTFYSPMFPEPVRIFGQPQTSR